VKIVSTALRLEWEEWFLGIMGAIISGGAGAVGSAFGSIVLDPEKFNVSQGFLHLLAMMGISFTVCGLVSLGKFLQVHPVPNELQKSLTTAASANVEAGKAIATAQEQAPKGEL
jgi:hypothetical protein